MTVPPDAHPRKPKFPVPKGATDCHFHIFDPPFPGATEIAYKHVFNTLGLQRGVVVQASTQGNDSTRLLKALHELGPSFRSVGPADLTLSDKSLLELKKKGVFGARVNQRGEVQLKWEDVERFARKIEPLGWHLDFYIMPDQLEAWGSKLATLPVPFIIDHFGMLSPTDSPKTLLKLIDTGKCWVKLSAPYRISKEAFPYLDIAPLAKNLVKHAPERMLWASDWPHMRFEGAMPNDGDLLDLLHEWAGTHTKQILVDNPNALYH